MKDLSKALQPVVSFRFVNLTALYKTLCLIPGHYDTQEVVKYTVSEGGSNVDKYTLSYLNPDVLKDAGYSCDEVADDLNINLQGDGKTTYPITVTPAAGNSKYRDFLKYIKNVGSRIQKIRVTNNGSDSGRTQFDQFFEVTASSIGSKAGSDYINLSSCKDPKNFDLNMIDVDLEARNLVLDATTLLFLKVAPNTDFTIEFTLDK